MNEKPVNLYAKNGDVLWGVIHNPENAGSSLPVIVFLHGWAGNRLGPHRLFVPMARAFASAGYPCLRFDFRGRGDSAGDSAEVSILTMTEDTSLAVEFVRRTWANRFIVLCGICSGTKAAIAASSMHEISGMILLSPERMGCLAGTAGKASKSLKTIFTYIQKLFLPQTWKKLFERKINFRAVSSAMLRPEIASPEERAAENIWLDMLKSKFTGPVLMAFGTSDPEAAPAEKAYKHLFNEMKCPLEILHVEGANHSFYGTGWTKELIEEISQWLKSRHNHQNA